MVTPPRAAVRAAVGHRGERGRRRRAPARRADRVGAGVEGQVHVGVDQARAAASRRPGRRTACLGRTGHRRAHRDDGGAVEHDGRVRHELGAGAVEEPGGPDRGQPAAFGDGGGVPAVVMPAAPGRSRQPASVQLRSSGTEVRPAATQAAIWVRLPKPSFVQDVLDVGLRGALADVRGRGDLPVAEPLRRPGRRPRRSRRVSGPAPLPGQRAGQLRGPALQRAHAQPAGQRGGRGGQRGGLVAVAGPCRRASTRARWNRAWAGIGGMPARSLISMAAPQVPDRVVEPADRRRRDAERLPHGTA